MSRRDYTRPCPGCGAPLVARSDWLALTPERRADARRAGYRAHCGRGLCRACYWHAERTDALCDFERHNLAANELLDDWEMLRDDGYTVRQAAERLGITHAALDRALCRAKRRGDPRGERHAFGRAA